MYYVSVVFLYKTKELYHSRFYRMTEFFFFNKTGILLDSKFKSLSVCNLL